MLEEMAVIGLSSVWHYTVGDDGRVDLSADAPLASIRAVSAIKHKVRSDEDGSVTHEVELKLWDKNTALANIGKHLGMFVDRVKVDATVTQAPGRLDDSERARMLRDFLATRGN